MIFPLNIQIGTTIIPMHLILDIVAFAVATIYYLKLRSKSEDVITLEERLILIFGALVGVLIGSRLVASFEDVNYTIANFSALTIFAQQTIVGGIIGGIVGVEITKKIKSIRTATGDIYVFPLILGIMIGRVGCFLTGVSDRTVGLPCSLPWCFSQGDNIPRHPTSLYEILFLGILWIVLYKLNKRVVLDGGVLFRFFIIIYASYRLIIEFIKPHGTLFFGLSSIQLVCLAMVVFFVVQLFTRYRHKAMVLKRL
jgi:phosphatidylglycerol:prolipoprotein diacylglycerol transferase